ncbi:MAG: ATP-binding protein [Ectothiorhodospiraceae bacterium]|nr:ATP-binding protein [Chromatiales bacterium]MCP5154402.1 ATP-binding protein [Ectothiorhodospiraceae bacterium]
MRAMPDASTGFERVRLANHIGALDGALLVTDRFARVVGLDAHDARILRLVVEELVTNSITHGGAPPDAPIDLSLGVTAGAVLVECIDRGRPFDPNRDVPPASLDGGADGRPVGGLGWALIRHHCPCVEYRRDGHENHVRLLCRLPSTV